MVCCFVFFFKQKTAYEMRISDWSSDVCSSDLTPSAALLSSSQGSAKLLGIDGETGTLEAGKLADIVAVPGNVLQDIRATERPLLVMKQGGVVREHSGERDAECMLLPQEERTEQDKADLPQAPAVA